MSSTIPDTFFEQEEVASDYELFVLLHEIGHTQTLVGDDTPIPEIVADNWAIENSGITLDIAKKISHQCERKGCKKAKYLDSLQKIAGLGDILANIDIEIITRIENLN